MSIRELLIIFIVASIPVAQPGTYSGTYDEGPTIRASAIIKNTQEQVSSTSSTSQVRLTPGEIPSGRSHERVLYSPGDPVRIKKIIYPFGNGSYLLGDDIHIYVEIIPLVKELKDIHIHEYVDMNYNGGSNNFITHKSKCYILSQYYQFCLCKENASQGNHTINIPSANLEKFIIDINKLGPNYIKAHVDSIDRLDHIVYWYTIKPNNSGYYRSDTSLRFCDNNYYYSDVDHSVEIIIEDPEPRFDADIKYFQKNIRMKDWITDLPIFGDHFFNDSLNISYEIWYKGGAGEKCNNVSVIFEESCNQYDCSFDRPKLNLEGIELNETDPTATSLTINEIGEGDSRNISINIFYNKPGVYTPPRIKVGNNRYFIKFESYEIVVDTWWQRNRDYLLAFVAILGLFGIRNLSDNMNFWRYKLWWEKRKM